MLRKWIARDGIAPAAAIIILLMTCGLEISPAHAQQNSGGKPTVHTCQLQPADRMRGAGRGEPHIVNYLSESHHDRRVA